LRKYSSNFETEGDLFRPDIKEPLVPTDLQTQTQKEIFKRATVFKKPLNYMNYSNTDFNLINNEAEKMSQSFFDRRVDFPK
jgi:hypothetical protein